MVIGWLYLLPQLQGAGLTLTTITGWPPWVGAAAAAVVVVATVVLGGMRSITFVQAFQYWLKLTALALPAAVGLIFFLSDDRTFDRPAPPQFPEQATVQIRTDVVLQVGSPVTFVATGEVDGVSSRTTRSAGSPASTPCAGARSWSSRAGRRCRWSPAPRSPTRAG